MKTKEHGMESKTASHVAFCEGKFSDLSEDKLQDNVPSEASDQM